MMTTKELNNLFEIIDLQREMNNLEEHFEVYDMLYEHKYHKIAK